MSIKTATFLNATDGVVRVTAHGLPGIDIQSGATEDFDIYKAKAYRYCLASLVREKKLIPQDGGGEPGPKGDPPLMQSKDGFIQYSIDEGATWINLVDLTMFIPTFHITSDMELVVEYPEVEAEV